MSGHVIRSIAAVLAAADPALPASDPRVVDASGTPGNVAVGPGVRVIRCKVAIAANGLVITHPDITANSLVMASYEGNAPADPEATRRVSARCLLGQIIVEQSGGGVADDGPIVVRVEVV